MKVLECLWRETLQKNNIEGSVLEVPHSMGQPPYLGFLGFISIVTSVSFEARRYCGEGLVQRRYLVSLVPESKLPMTN